MVTTPLEKLVQDDSTFLYRKDKLYIFRPGMGNNDPCIIVGDLVIPSMPPHDLRSLEVAMADSDNSASLEQQRFLEHVFSENFYSARVLTDLQKNEAIAQYTFAEAMPALLVAYSSLLGTPLPDEKSFSAAQDIIFSTIMQNSEHVAFETEITEDQLVRCFKNASRKMMPQASDGYPLNNRSSLFTQTTSIKELFSIDGRLYSLDPEKNTGIQVMVDGIRFGLEQFRRIDLSDYSDFFTRYIKSRSVDDQAGYITDLIPKARLGMKFKAAAKRAEMEFGDDVKIGCQWLEQGMSLGDSSDSMVIYIRTPTIFIRGVKVRPDEYNHLPDSARSEDKELLYWRFPPNRVCIFVSHSYNSLMITSPAIIDFVPHTGIASSLHGSLSEGTGRYNFMCGVQGGEKRKPMGQDAVDLIGIALNYYMNGISPETVTRHSDGEGFRISYNKCFPIGEGYTERQVNAIIEDMAGKGQTVWKGNHMHLPFEDR